MSSFDYKAFLSTLPNRPGVYRMYDKAGKVLYVGKAKNLSHRVKSYFRVQTDARLNQLVAKIASIDVTVTYSENEALLLEHSLIQSLKPQYNIIYRDDKSYPFLFLSNHTFPRLVYFRGKQKFPGKYFGPYPSTLAVKETLTILQKCFQLRQCDDTFFSHRSRPCLQYQIKRCSAPCVRYISEETYQQDVAHVVLFLQGKEGALIENLIEKMKQTAEHQDFEKAASYRDQIASLRAIYEQQTVQKQKGDLDVIAACTHKGIACLQYLYIRQGRILDSQTFYPKQTGEGNLSVLLRAFLIQFYLGNESKSDYPKAILLNESVEDQDLIAQMLSQRLERRIEINHPQRGEKMQWIQLAQENALQALERRTQSRNLILQRWEELKKVLGLSQLTRIDCFDVSHLQGEAAMASCVVFNIDGPLKSDYRRYHLNTPPNDDYAAMEAAVIKKYLKAKQEEHPLPEVILIDGGKGQLHRAQKALLECQILDVLIIGIAKGEGRKPGLETLYVASQNEAEKIIKLPPMSSALHLLQHLRDESHRFAITGHRNARSKARNRSPLESIPGIGAARRQKLLNYFGGQQGLVAASSTTIAQVPGISKTLADKIYAALHP